MNSFPFLNIIICVHENIEKPTFLDLHGIKDITVKAGRDFQVQAPYKAVPRPQAQVMIGDTEMVNDDRASVKVN